MNINFNNGIPQFSNIPQTEAVKKDIEKGVNILPLGSETKDIGDKLLNFYPGLNISAIDKADAVDLAQLSQLAGIGAINVTKEVYTRIGNEVKTADKAISDFTTTNNAKDSLAAFDALV